MLTKIFFHGLNPRRNGNERSLSLFVCVFIEPLAHVEVWVFEMEVDVVALQIVGRDHKEACRTDEHNTSACNTMEILH